MLPISSISQALSAYGIQPQANIGMPDGMAKLPGMEGITTAVPASMPSIALPNLPSSAPASMPSGVSGASSSDSFGSMLGKFVQDVNSKQVDAGNAVASLQAGGGTSLHQAVIAMEEANVSFQLMVEVRNKLLDAYQEIMRMQV